MVTVNVWLAVFPYESVALTVKLALPPTGLFPDRTPPLDTLRPTAVRLLLPDVTDQVKPVPVPPEVARVVE
jgi:hypothetical protein